MLALAERFDSLLSTILIGNNIVNIAMSSIATVLFTRLLGGMYGPTVATVVITLLVLAFTSKSSRAPKAEGTPYDKGSR